MTRIEKGYSGEKESSISTGLERAARRRAKFHTEKTLHDFVEWLADRPETLVFGLGSPSIPAKALVKEFIDEQGLNGHEPGAIKPKRIGVLAKPYPALKAEIAAMQSRDALIVLLREEQDGKNRLAITTAIKNRLDELK